MTYSKLLHVSHEEDRFRPVVEYICSFNDERPRGNRVRSLSRPQMFHSEAERICERFPLGPASMPLWARPVPFSSPAAGMLTRSRGDVLCLQYSSS